MKIPKNEKIVAKRTVETTTSRDGETETTEHDTVTLQPTHEDGNGNWIGNGDPSKLSREQLGILRQLTRLQLSLRSPQTSLEAAGGLTRKLIADDR